MEPYAIFNVGFKSLKYLNGICDICNVAFIFFTKEVVFWLFWSLYSVESKVHATYDSTQQILLSKNGDGIVRLMHANQNPFLYVALE